MKIESKLYETHSHTPLCKHAVGMPEDYAAVAHERGLSGLIVTCHNPMPDGFASHVRMAAEEMGEYVDMVQKAREDWDDAVDVLLGLEADYFPGHETWLEQQLKAHDFHYVLGSVHPQLAEYKQQFWCKDPLENQRVYFDMLAAAAETKLFDTLAHPDLIKNQTADGWIPERVMPDICRALDRIAATGVAMELNTSGVNKVVPEMNPFPGMLAEICTRGIPVVVGSDAHVPQRVADGFEDALRTLASVGFTEVSRFYQRQRVSIPMETAQQSLRPVLERPVVK